MKRIIISVTNDLVTDQRVRKIGACLGHMGYDILMVGRRNRKSPSYEDPFQSKRFHMWFEKGFLFYAEYNLRLFFLLLFSRADVLLANDLDTLLPNFLVSKIRNRMLVYDSHELFTEVPELKSRPRVRNFWKGLEQWIFPRLKYVYTVNEKIAEIYRKEYGVRVCVIRNMAHASYTEKPDPKLAEKIKGEKSLLILQGSGINIDRGAEEAVLMMSHLDNAILLIAGDGDVYPYLRTLTINNGLEGKVLFLPRLPYSELMEYTRIADLGLSLDKGTNLNYEYGLPNKVFDYIQAQVPVLASNREVLGSFIEQQGVGWLCRSHDPEQLAETVKKILDDREDYQSKKIHVQKAAQILNWEKEQEKCVKFYEQLET